MPNPGPNERKLELPEASASAALTVQHSPAPPALLVPGGWRIEGLPRTVREAGPSAERRLLEFFTAEISNPNTRLAYSTAAGRFFRVVRDPQPGASRPSLPLPSPPISRRCRTAMPCPPSSSTSPPSGPCSTTWSWARSCPRTPPHRSADPNTWSSTARPRCSPPGEARTLLDSIDLARPSGLRDRALLATMVYSFARVGAVVGMNVEDYYRQGKRWWLRLHEKGGKFHQVPAHHNAEEYLDAYLEAAGIGDEKGTPLWRSMTKGGTVTPNRMNRVDVFRMIKRRVRQAELGVAANCHTFRATGITAYLLNGGTVENAQAIAAHESPRTTKLYDRTADEISLDEIERIVI